MGCPGDVELNAYLQGAMAASVEQGLDQHIDACPSCQQVIAAVARMASPPDVPVAPAPTIASELGRGSSVGRYLVIERVGSGAMGVVYAAYDPELDRRVALKVLHPSTWRARPRERDASCPQPAAR